MRNSVIRLKSKNLHNLNFMRRVHSGFSSAVCVLNERSRAPNELWRGCGILLFALSLPCARVYRALSSRSVCSKRVKNHEREEPNDQMQ